MYVSPPAQRVPGSERVKLNKVVSRFFEIVDCINPQIVMTKCNNKHDTIDLKQPLGI